MDSVRELNIHATAEQVYEHVAKRHPAISKATVYRNLSRMAEAGELLDIGSFDGSAHYDHNCHRHYHFVCAACSRVYDVDGDIPDLTSELTGMENFVVTGWSLTFSGLCGDCNTDSAWKKLNQYK